MLRAYTKQMGMDGPFSLILSFASSIFPLILTSSRHHSSAFRAGSAPVEHRGCGQGHKTNAPRVCNRQMSDTDGGQSCLWNRVVVIVFVIGCLCCILFFRFLFRSLSFTRPYCEVRGFHRFESSCTIIIR